MPTIFDPRKVEPRFRNYAFLISSVMASGVCFYVAFTATSMLRRPNPVVSSEERDWGMLPDLSLCAYNGNQVKFAYSGVYSNPSMPFGFQNTLYPDSPLNISIKAAMPGDTYSTHMYTSCVVIYTSVLTPTMQKGVDMSVEFRISFEHMFKRGSISSGYNEIRSDFTLSAVDEEGHYAGTVAHPRPVMGDMRDVQNVISIKKKKIITEDNTAHYHYDAKFEEISIEHASNPRDKIEPSMQDAFFSEFVSNETDPDNPSLWVVSIFLQLYAPYGLGPTVRVVRFISKWTMLAQLMGSLGGFITISSIFMGNLFPRKYPVSKVAATYEQLTLYGYPLLDAEPKIDPEEDKFGQHSGLLQAFRSTGCSADHGDSDEEL